MPTAARPMCLSKHCAAPRRPVSFPIEEAYNQEPGVVQYLVGAWYVRPDDVWAVALTNEWPVPGQTHQVSYTVPYARQSGGPNGVGDLTLNYRYQLATQERAAAAVAPRLSAILPTGDWRRGRGGYGAQVNLPVSRRFSRALVGHFNLGATWYHAARTVLGGSNFRDDLTGVFAGASAIWLAGPRVNAMLELLAWSDEERTGVAGTERRTRAVLSPGLRHAMDTRCGQLVLGIAVPVGLNAASPDPGPFLYLSWEAPHWRR